MNAGAVRMQSRHAPSLPDLVNWCAAVADGAVLNKDGSLMAGWAFRGPDQSSMPPRRRDQAMRIANAALASLGADWMLHVDAVRSPAAAVPADAASAWPDRATRWIEAERRAALSADHYETSTALVATWLPPKAASRRLADLMFSDGGAAQPSASGEALLERFERGCAELEARLSAALELERLRDLEIVDGRGVRRPCSPLLSHLRLALTGERAQIGAPESGMYVDAAIAGQELWVGMIPRIGTRYQMAVAIDGFPAATGAGALAGLCELPVECRWSTRFICADLVDAQAALRARRRQWQQKVRGAWDQILHRQPRADALLDADAQEMVGETEAALAEASGGAVRYGAYTSVVVVARERREDAEAAAREVWRALQHMGFGARIETVNTVEAILGSLPGHAQPNIRRPMLHTLHLANLLPLHSVWTGSPAAACPMYPPGSPALVSAATGSTPCWLNLHVGDVGHTLMFGPTGSGKSTALALLAAQFRRYPGASVFAFDAGRSLEILTRAVGGGHYDVLADGDGLSFAPLAEIGGEGELSWAAEWAETLIELQGERMTPARRAELSRALESLVGAEDRTLTALQTAVQDGGLKQALAPYTISGRYGQTLDAERDGLEVGDWACFEVQELMQRDDRIRLPVLLYLFRVLERRMRGQPCLLLLDEAWLMLGHPAFRERIREWLKTLRKANVAVVLATQSLSDAARSGIADVLSESCPTRILLANPDAEQADAAALYRRLGLSETDISAIRHMTPKREYLIAQTGEGSRVIDFALGPVALSFLGVNDREARARARELEREHGADWPARWLEERGVSLPAAAAPSAISPRDAGPH